MTAQKRRRCRPGLLLLSLAQVSGSASVSASAAAAAAAASSVGASTKPAQVVPAPETEPKASNRSRLRGSEADTSTSFAPSNAHDDERRASIVDLAAPIYDEAVIPSPLELKAAGTSGSRGPAKIISSGQADYAYSSPATASERDLKKNKGEDEEASGEAEEEETNDDEDSDDEATGNTIYISAGTIDLTNSNTNSNTTVVTASSSTTVAAEESARCYAIEPLMGCDRGGAANQRLTFFGADFGLGCAQADRCLFALMPIRMAYYCPEQARPACGGQCYTAEEDCPADGILVDASGVGHDITDKKWTQANGAGWNFWPANFGCPSCV